MAFVDTVVELVCEPSDTVVPFAGLRMTQLDYSRELAAVVDREIVMVICTFAFDLQRDREYSDRFVGMGMERMDKWAGQFELMESGEEDRIAVGFEVQAEQLSPPVAAAECHLSCQRATSNLR